MNADHSDYAALASQAAKAPRGQEVFIRSGIRFDYLLADKQDTFLRELVQYHMPRSAEGRPGARIRRRSRPDGQAPNAVYNRFVEKYFAPEPAVQAI
ncbi:MAG: hypothetical protein ACLU9S_05995 [Oscillospiraceae bacterium]